MLSVFSTLDIADAAAGAAHANRITEAVMAQISFFMVYTPFLPSRMDRISIASSLFSFTARLEYPARAIPVLLH